MQRTLKRITTRKSSPPILSLGSLSPGLGQDARKNIISIHSAINSQTTISYPGINQCTFSTSQCTQLQASELLPLPLAQTHNEAKKELSGKALVPLAHSMAKAWESVWDGKFSNPWGIQSRQTPRKWPSILLVERVPAGSFLAWYLFMHHARQLKLRWDFCGSCTAISV